jgi:hypothetical protein
MRSGSRFRSTVSVAAACVAFLTATRSALGDTFEIGPGDDLRASVNALAAGDELVLQGGIYDISARFSIGISGTESEPIVIRAKQGEVPVITRPDANQNTINIESAQHVTLRGIEVRGGSHGIRLNDSDYISIEECHIHDTGDVALSANVTDSSYQGLRFLRNHIHHTNGTGEGMYLGCNYAGCVMFDSLIEGNYIHHTTGTEQGDGIEIKHGSYNNTVRDNVIHDTNYPCIIVYGTAGQSPNIIERNAIWACGNHGIQAAADAVIRNNIILSPNDNGIHSQIHQDAVPGNLTIVHNTVIGLNEAIRVNDISAAVLIANNALYSQNANAIRAGGNTSLLTAAGNLGVGGLQGVAAGFDPGGDIGSDVVDADFTGSSLNVFPAADSALIAAGDPAHVTRGDFNGTPRNGVADVGAYAYAVSGNPGWAVAPGFKDSSSEPAPTDDGGVTPPLSDGGPEPPVADGGRPEDGSGGIGGDSAAGSAGGGSGATGDSGASAGQAGYDGTAGGAGGQVTASGAAAADGAADGPTPNQGGGGCGCSAAGTENDNTPFPALGVSLLITLFIRRRG